MLALGLRFMDEWSLIELRKHASTLLSEQEYEALTIVMWDEWWQQRLTFTEATVGRYRQGLLVVRASEAVNVFAFMAHELGHHVTMHETGRAHHSFRMCLNGVELRHQRGFTEGVADAFCLHWGQEANVAYQRRGGDFRVGYQRGLRFNQFS